MVVAVIGQCSASSNPACARQLGVASIAFSIIGLVLTVVIVISTILLGIDYTKLLELLHVRD